MRRSTDVDPKLIERTRACYCASGTRTHLDREPRRTLRIRPGPGSIRRLGPLQHDRLCRLAVYATTPVMTVPK